MTYAVYPSVLYLLGISANAANEHLGNVCEPQTSFHMITGQLVDVDSYFLGLIYRSFIMTLTTPLDHETLSLFSRSGHSRYYSQY